MLFRRWFVKIDLPFQNTVAIRLRMVTRTDDRREAIIEAATAVFREVGFGRASMNAITARAGGSKATLYKYFGSKEELFAVAMTEAIEEQATSLLNILLAATEEPRLVLTRYAEGYLRLITSPDVLALTRTAIGEGAQTSLGPMLYVRGPKRALNALVEYFGTLGDNGAIRQIDSRLAAAQFRGLLEAGVFEPLLYGAPSEFPIEHVAQAAIDTFWGAYGRD